MRHFFVVFGWTSPFAPPIIESVNDWKICEIESKNCSSGDCYHELELETEDLPQIYQVYSSVVGDYLLHVDCVTHHHAKEHVRGDLFLDKCKYRGKVPNQ